MDPTPYSPETGYCTIVSTVFTVCIQAVAIDDTMNISKPERATQVREYLSTSITHKNCYIKEQ